MAEKRVAKNGCASSKVATAGGAIGGRAGTGGHYQLESDGLSRDWLTFGISPTLNGEDYTPLRLSVNDFCN